MPDTGNRQFCLSLSFRIPLLRRLFLITALCCSVPLPAAADSPSLMGPLGLITIPSARMDEPGMARAQFAAAEPYIHAHAGVQIAAPLHIALRQSARTSSLSEDPDRLYPGVDLRLRLVKENA